MSATFLSPNAMNDDIPLPVMRAAEARANGLSMSAAATAGGWTIDGLRRWINRHSATWYRVLKRARCDARDAACDEAVAFLRKHLRADEDKTSLQAAGSLAVNFAAAKNKGTPKKTMPDAEQDMSRHWLEKVPGDGNTRIDMHLAASEEESRAAAAALTSAKGGDNM